VKSITWDDAADYAEQTATTIRNMAKAFVASPMTQETANIRAEALELFAEGCRKKALESEA
jgi:hypothetical protein